MAKIKTNVNCSPHKDQQNVKGLGSTFLDTLELRSDFFKSKSHETLYKTAIAKHNTLTKIYSILDVCENHRKPNYWKTWHCSNVVLQNGTALVTGLCRKRWCNVCARKKTSELINGYSESLSQLQAEDNCFLVTLTAQTIKANNAKRLKAEFQLYNKELKRAIDSIRKTHKTPLNGFKKVESTHNPITNEFHPHLHLIIQGEANANLLVDYWIKQMTKRYGKKKINRGAQKIQRIGNTAKDYIEVFKYATKGSVKDSIDAKAEDLMIEAMEGIQVFKPIGKLRKVKKPIEDKEQRLSADFIEPKHEIYVYSPKEKDYISANYTPLIGTQSIEQRINKESGLNRFKTSNINTSK
jgi:hypothetical protein